MTVSLGDICRVVNVKKDFKGQHLGVNSFLSSKKCLVYLSALVLVFLPHKPFDANNVHLCISIYRGTKHRSVQSSAHREKLEERVLSQGRLFDSRVANVESDLLASRWHFR